jgi:hypothetical protein
MTGRKHFVQFDLRLTAEEERQLMEYESTPHQHRNATSLGLFEAMRLLKQYTVTLNQSQETRAGPTIALAGLYARRQCIEYYRLTIPMQQLETSIRSCHGQRRSLFQALLDAQNSFVRLDLELQIASSAKSDPARDQTAAECLQTMAQIRNSLEVDETLDNSWHSSTVHSGSTCTDSGLYRQDGAASAGRLSHSRSFQDSDNISSAAISVNSPTCQQNVTMASNPMPETSQRTWQPRIPR